VSEQPVTTEWGNAVRDQVVHLVHAYPLPTEGIRDGALAYVTTDDRLYLRAKDVWETVWPAAYSLPAGTDPADVLAWDGDEWVSSGPPTLSWLTDVDDEMAPAEGQMLVYSGGQWIAADPVPPGTWQTITLENNWVPQGGSYQAPRYRLEGDVVRVEGNIKSGTDSVNTTLFTLPAGYRPAATQLRNAVHAGSAQVTPVAINSDGTVKLARAASDRNSFGLGQIQFTVAGPTEQIQPPHMAQTLPAEVEAAEAAIS
jgi:hypothetical protein